MITDTNNEYTLENLPTTIPEDQFYCYSKKTGKITLGEVIGKSAITKHIHYRVFGHTYRAYHWLNEDINVITPERNIKCFADFQTFLKDYNDYLKEKAKKVKTNKKRYVVSKSTFVCRETKASYAGCNLVEFDNKQDAIDYANKGLAKLKKEVNKFYKTLNELKDELKTIKEKVLQFETYSEIKPASHYDIKENDVLTKMDLKRFKRLSYLDVVDDYIVSVKYFISPNVAKLSDGTIFINGENNRSYPRLIHYAQAKEAKEICKKKAINRVIEDVGWEIKDLARLIPFAEEYVPFKKYNKIVPFYNSKSTKDIIDDVKEIIKIFNNSNE